MSLDHIICIEDLRELHMRRVPKAFFDYFDRGSYCDDTLRANCADLERSNFASVSLSMSQNAISRPPSSVRSDLPLILAPVG